MNYEQFKDLMESSSEENFVCITNLGSLTLPHYDHRFIAYKTEGQGNHMSIRVQDNEWTEGQSSGFFGSPADAMRWIAARVLYNL